MRSKVKEAMQEFGTIAPIEFKEVPKSEPLDFKIYGIKTSKNPEIVGFVRHTLMSEKKLFLQNSSENKMKTVCTVEGEKQECVEKQLTDSELQEQKALNDTFSQLLVRHELMHILGAKHPHHAELLNTGFRVNPKEMSDYKNSVMFYESNSGVQPGDEITLGKFDKEYIIRHYGAKRAPKNPNSIKR